jgi:hypothetical protein
VPNSARVPILSPIGSAKICPLGSEERWELRARPFGCRASSLTVLSVVVSVLVTLAVIGAGYGLLYLARSVRRRWKEINSEPLNDQEQRWSLGNLPNKLMFSLARVVGRSRQRDEQGQFLAEDARDSGETRPLLE